MNYLQKKKLAFMSIVNRVKGFVRTAVGVPPLVLPDCVGDNLINYSISGNSVQDGTPTPDNPVEIESVGEYDEATGKYKIPIKVSGDSGSTETVIYLDEPLRKVGDVSDYIDFENGKIVRNITYKKLMSNDNWNLPGVVTEGYSYFRIMGFFEENPVSAFQCTHFETEPEYNYYYNPKNRATSFPNTNQLIITISNDIADSLSQTSLEEWKEWLLDKNVYVYFIKTTPTEEVIDLPIIPQLKGTTVLAPNTTVQPSQMSATYYSTSKE